MAEPIITKQQLEARLGASVVLRLTDHNNDGVADKTALDQICHDATVRVLRKLGPVYKTGSLPGDALAEVASITLDVAQAIAAQRYPYFSFDWVEMLRQSDKDLDAIRKGLDNLGTGTSSAPEPAANHGVRVVSGNPASPDCFPPRFSDNWGRF